MLTVAGVEPGARSRAFGRSVRQAGVFIFRTPYERSANYLSLFGARDEWSSHLQQGTKVSRPGKRSQEERSKLAFGAWERARSDFSIFLRPIIVSRSTGGPYPDQTHYHAKIVAFLNAPPLLDFIRT